MNKTIRKILVFISIVLFFSALFGGFIHYIIDINPRINTIIELRSISKDEYYKIPDFEKYNIEDIKKLNVQVDILDSAYSKIRDIHIPDLNLLDRIDYARSFSCSSSEINNLKSDNAQSIKYIVFNSKDLDISKLKKTFLNKNIYINITTKYNKKIELKYDIGKLLDESE